MNDELPVEKRDGADQTAALLKCWADVAKEAYDVLGDFPEVTIVRNVGSFVADRLRVIDAASRHLIAELDQLRCGCSAGQILSGHHVDCRMPWVNDATEDLRRALAPELPVSGHEGTHPQ